MHHHSKMSKHLSIKKLYRNVNLAMLSGDELYECEAGTIFTYRPFKRLKYPFRHRAMRRQHT